MEQPGVVASNQFALSFSLISLSIFVHISGAIRPIILFWASLERLFPPAEVEYRRCQFWSKVMTSEVEERTTLATVVYNWHGSQWVKPDEWISCSILSVVYALLNCFSFFEYFGI